MTVILQVERLAKSFRMHHLDETLAAFREIDFTLMTGEFLLLCGHNGVGKSTLLRTLYRSYLPDAGRILIEGVPRHFRDPLDAYHAGVAVVHQETSLIPTATAVQNVFLGRERLRGPVLDERTVGLKEIFALEVGSRLMFDATPDSLIEMRCSGVPMYAARMGRSGERIAVQIDSQAQQRIDHKQAGRGS